MAGSRNKELHFHLFIIACRYKVFASVCCQLLKLRSFRKQEQVSKKLRVKEQRKISHQWAQGASCVSSQGGQYNDMIGVAVRDMLTQLHPI